MCNLIVQLHVCGFIFDFPMHFSCTNYFLAYVRYAQPFTHLHAILDSHELFTLISHML